jgi:ribosomal protein L37AE/L43A
MVEDCDLEDSAMTIKKIVKLKKRKEFIERLMRYHREYYTDGGFPSIFSLQQRMIEKGICPRCGDIGRVRSSAMGFSPCWKCGFKLTNKEAEKINPDEDRISEKTKRRILKRRLMEKMVIDDGK